MEAAVDRKVQREIEERMGVLQTALKKAEVSVAESEDHLEESWIWGEEAHQGDQGQSDSSEGQDGDVMVEGPEERCGVHRSCQKPRGRALHGGGCGRHPAIDLS